MIPKARSFDAEGKDGEVDLASDLFDVQVNVPVMHEVVRAQLAAARAGTHSTKTRGEVRGGGRKPWRQKGTGRARHGSIREPQWVGGGVAHGPKPRDHSFRVNRKTRALALRSALTDRAREGRVIVVDIPAFEVPDTKQAVELLEQWGVKGKALFVASRSEEEPHRNAWKSFRNLPEVLTVSYPTAYTVLAADTIVFTRAALTELSFPRSSEESDPVPAGATEGLARASEGEDSSGTDPRALRKSDEEAWSPSNEQEPDVAPVKAGSSDDPAAGAPAEGRSDSSEEGDEQ